MAQSNLGRVLHKLGRYEDAEAHLRRAVALNPKDKSYRYHLGEALYDLGRYDEMLTLFRALASHYPNDAGAYSNMGIFLLNKEISCKSSAFLLLLAGSMTEDRKTAHIFNEITLTIML